MLLFGFIAGFLAGATMTTIGFVRIAEKRRVLWLMFPAHFDAPDDGFNFLDVDLN